MFNAEMFVGLRMSEPRVVAAGHGTAAIFSASGKLEPNLANEDGAAVVALDDGRLVLVVADGAGGLPCGDRASELAVRAVTDACTHASDGSVGLREAILDGFESANRQVLELGVGAATTLAVIEIADGVLRPYHAGDSAVLVTGQRGRVKLMTTFHSPVGYAVEAGLLDHADAMHHEERHVVSNLVGQNDMRIELGAALKLSAHDTVVIASDGLFDNLHPQEIVEIVRKGDLANAATELCRATMQRMQTQGEATPSKPDDLTFILYRAGNQSTQGSAHSQRR